MEDSMHRLPLVDRHARNIAVTVLAVSIGVLLVPSAAAQRKPASAGAKGAAAQPSPDAGPIVVVDTVKGAFEFETYPKDAPKSVEHILALVKRNFYNGLRVHRVEPNVVVQWGDTRTRDMTKRDQWGRAGAGGSGRPIGTAEISTTRKHVRGAVGLAYAGDAAQADSQIYVVLSNRPALDGKYAVIGKVLSGMDVVSKLEVTDVIKRMTLKP
jgi:cyclophilin family peptidyl-prolyl cis-trans isomerase